MKKSRILILDGNENFANELTRHFCEHTDYEVCGISGDGTSALDLVQTTKPDVIILNLVLKGLDGFAVLDKLKESNCAFNIIAIGNITEENLIASAIERGASYYLMKPFTPATLTAIIDDLVKNPNNSAIPLYREKKSGSTLEERISHIFISIGIPPNIKGYNFLREGIKYAVEDPSIINKITKELYPKIAERFDTSPSKVERAIRHSIEVAWNRGRIDAINAIFGVRVYIGTEKPTNSEFIALVADKLILEGIVNG